MTVVHHRPTPIGLHARQHRLPTPPATDSRRTPDSEATPRHERATSGEHWTDAVLYLDRTLRITYTLTSPISTVQLIGELDATNTQAAARTLTQAGTAEETLTIDIGHLEFVDVAGLRMLTDLCRDGTAHLTNAPIDIRRLLGLLNRTDILAKCA
ncbi:STAS domain-containing protein [Streptosporangium sp. NPDC000509]|uniref:STAS domain-containing protein n=1 Tax=Streptosporangium sp. NPDC000509 TaxID=3366186 RepID=UPI0036CE4E74